jgi:hypothetical protein
MTKRRKRITARELVAQLGADPAYQARFRQQEDERLRREAEFTVAEAPLVADLAATGLAVGSVWDLVNTAKPYPEAIPVLLKHLPRPYPDRIREGIARALAVSDARHAWPTLADAFRVEPRSGTKDGLACALAAIAGDDVLDELIGLLRDSSQGESRVLLVRALRRSKEPRAQRALMELGADPVLAKEVQHVLTSRRKK